MQKHATALICFVAIVLACTGWMFRWQTLSARSNSDQHDVYLLNRWTGEIILIEGLRWGKVTHVRDAP